MKREFLRLGYPAAAAMAEEVVGMGYLLEQVTQKDLGKRLQVGQEVIEIILNEEKSPELEQDQTMMDRTVDAVASSWVNSSNFKVRIVKIKQINNTLHSSPHLFKNNSRVVTEEDTSVSAVVLQLFGHTAAVEHMTLPILYP